MSSSSEDPQDAPVQLASKTDVGRVRQANEDSCETWRFDDGSCLLAVADGMGGHKGGATASRTAIQAIAETFGADTGGATSEILGEAIRAANARIWDLARRDPELEGMGTTVVAFHLDARRRGTVAHVGDSRAYRLRAGRLEALTGDHSVVAEMQRRGLLSPEEAAVHPRRNEILRSVGVQEEVRVDVAEVDVAPGDRFLLCSDGLSGVVQDDEIGALVRTKSPAEAVDALIALANERGGPDNVTVQILALAASGAETAPARGGAEDPETTAPVVVTRVTPETRAARQRDRAKRLGAVLAIAGGIFAAWLLWQATGAPDPAPSETTRAAPPVPGDRFEVEAPTPRRGIPRDGASR
ncbi:MAG: Stp1/IreP family PP2C-type Ser/Thr phosphatase [Myxococcota bacterium]